MRKFALVLVVLLTTSGCSLSWFTKAPITKPIFDLQRPAVQAATEASGSARDNWKDYKADDQAAYLKANADAWQNLNRVYNPPEEGTTSPVPASSAEASGDGTTQ